MLPSPYLTQRRTIQVSRWLVGRDQLPRSEPAFEMLTILENRENPNLSAPLGCWAGFAFRLVVIRMNLISGRLLDLRSGNVGLLLALEIVRNDSKRVVIL